MATVKKHLGQNFLNSKSIIKKIIKTLDLKDSDTIIEIGPGKGAITIPLVHYAFDKKFNELNYFGYELDINLYESLKAKMRSKYNLNLYNEDFLYTDLTKFRNYKVVGTIPYYITSPILHKLLRQENRADLIVLVIQDEVASKMLEATPKGNYWSHITYGYDIEKIDKLPPSVFTPRPKVNSAIIKMTLKRYDTFAKIGDFDKYSKFLHHTFRQPRKMLNKHFDIEMLKKVGVNPSDRAQNLTIEQLIRLYREFH